MSGFLGQILGGVMGGGQAGQASPISGILQQVMSIRDEQGNTGVAAIMSKFQAAGLGSQVQSWVGTGANQPVSPDHIAQAFSPEQIQGWATQAGTTPEAVTQLLAEAMPHAIDHLTPDGQVPSGTPDLSGMLTRLLGSFGQPRQE